MFFVLLVVICKCCSCLFVVVGFVRFVMVLCGFAAFCLCGAVLFCVIRCVPLHVLHMSMLFCVYVCVCVVVHAILPVSM